MKNPPAVRLGDRVQVVFEGTARATLTGGDNFNIGLGVFANLIQPRADHVVSIEVLKSVVEVGDIIPVERAELLPVGSVVIGMGSRARHFRTSEKWVVQQPGNLVIGCTGGDYRVEFLPGDAA